METVVFDAVVDIFVVVDVAVDFVVVDVVVVDFVVVGIVVVDVVADIVVDIDKSKSEISMTSRLAAVSWGFDGWRVVGVYVGLSLYVSLSSS